MINEYYILWTIIIFSFKLIIFSIFYSFDNSHRICILIKIKAILRRLILRKMKNYLSKYLSQTRKNIMFTICFPKRIRIMSNPFAIWTNAILSRTLPKITIVLNAIRNIMDIFLVHTLIIKTSKTKSISKITKKHINVATIIVKNSSTYNRVYLDTKSFILEKNRILAIMKAAPKVLIKSRI